MNFPTLPDNISKLVLIAGLFLIGFAWIEYNESRDLYNHTVLDLNAAIDSSNIKHAITKHSQQKIKDKSKQLAEKNGVKNPITITDTNFAIDFQYKTNDPKALYLDSAFNALYTELDDANFDLSVQSDLIKLKRERLKDVENEYDTMSIQMGVIAVVGALLLIAGWIALASEQSIMNRILIAENKRKGLLAEYCQSCGKVFSAIRESGSYATGEKNYVFCNSCYDKGLFTEPDLTLGQLEARVKEACKSMSKSEQKAILKRIRSLDRWKLNEY